MTAESTLQIGDEVRGRANCVQHELQLATEASAEQRAAHAARRGCSFVCTARHAVDRNGPACAGSSGRCQTAAGRCSPNSSLPESAARPGPFQRHALNPP
jgi:hypothetical protein